MAEDKAAQPLLGLAEASDYLAQLLARLDRLDSGAGLPLTLSLEEPLSDLLDTQADPQRRALGLSEGDKESVLETLEGYLCDNRF